MKRCLMYSQHLLGMGHFVRTLHIASGLTGLEVRLVNGGETAPGMAEGAGVEIVNLPALRSDEEFKTLSADDGGDLLATSCTRREALLDQVGEFDPDVIVIEHFPFGRSTFAAELRPMLARNRLEGGRAKILCSLRDILVTHNQQARFEARVCPLLNRYFDALLVHGDPSVHRLDDTFSRVRELTPPVHYTGYVTAPVAERAGPGEPPAEEGAGPLVLVSIGGGRVGHELITACIAASDALQVSLPHRMVIFTGLLCPEEAVAKLLVQASASPQVRLERWTSRFAEWMDRCDLSISMGGYNTCMNVLASGARALVHPFTGGHNTEQTERAKRFERLGLLHLLDPSELAPDRLAEAIRGALARPRTSVRVNLDGVANTNRLIHEMLDRAPRPALRAVSARPGLPEASRRALRAGLDAVAQRGAQARVFLRDDDVALDEPSLRDLLDVTVSNRVPLNLQIIPGQLDDAGAELLKDSKRQHWELIELNQHGWAHVNHEPDGKKYEFGPARSFQQQREDIDRGRALLEKRLPELFSPVFTPPWNRCTADTFTALEACGFAVLSRDAGARPIADAAGLAEVPVTLDLFTWQQRPQLRPLEVLVGDLLEQLAAGGTIGIMLHHAFMGGRPMEVLDALLGVMRDSGAVAFTTIEALAKVVA